MPKLFGKEVPPIIIVGLAAVAAVATYTALVPAEAPKAKGTPTKRLSAKVSSKAVSYTAEDMTYKFARHAEAPRNTFKPLVVRQDVAAIPSAPGEIPNTVTGGGKWVYSGRVVVNGVAQGLLENRATGDAEFVEKGQRWKNSTILEVQSDSITLSGLDGATFTINAGESTEPGPGANVSALPGVAPVNVPPGMMGQIGGNMNVQPTGDPNQNNNGGGGRRRNRGWNQFNQGNEE